MSEFEAGLDVIGALAEKTGFLASNGEARRALKQNSVSVNFSKVKEGFIIKQSDLINNRFVVIQKGKRNQFLIRAI